jgi:lauroyl/myristoyl acyltransferase
MVRRFARRYPGQYQLITDAVEDMIRKYPEQWFWVHKRWKKYYPDFIQSIR